MNVIFQLVVFVCAVLLGSGYWGSIAIYKIKQADQPELFSRLLTAPWWLQPDNWLTRVSGFVFMLYESVALTVIMVWAISLNLGTVLSANAIEQVKEAVQRLNQDERYASIDYPDHEWQTSVLDRVRVLSSDVMPALSVWGTAVSGLTTSTMLTTSLRCQLSCSVSGHSVSR